MSLQQPKRRVPSIAKSIDSVLDTPPASPPVRPLAKLRPSWIGPVPADRPTTPGISGMKQQVTVQYLAPGLQPPVFILTSLSDPQWDPLEMHPEANGHGGYLFSKVFQVEEGEYQYKFRLGEGDWWVCDESIATVDDGYGNKNNLLVVRPNQQEHMTLTKAAPTPEKATATEPQKVAKIPETNPTPLAQPGSSLKTAHDELPVLAPLMKHETFVPQKGSEAEQTPEREEPNPIDVDEKEPSESHARTRMHDRTHAGKAVSQNLPTLNTSDSEDEDKQPASPLLRHETFASSSINQDRSRLFSHESVAVSTISTRTPALSITPPKAYHRSGEASPIPSEASPDDHSLERFPTDLAGIMEKIHHVHKRLPEDEMVHHDELDSPASQALSDSSVSVPSLPSVREDDEENLEKIREAEEQEVEKEERTGEEMDPLRAGPSPEPEDADFESKVMMIQEKVEIEEKIIIEIVEQRRSLMAELIGRVGGSGNALAVAVGLLVIAAGICTMQFL